MDRNITESDIASKSLTLEILGDLPDASVKPPDNVLFVCKLNPITRDKDLELIFSRFGPIKTCEIIKDKLTGDSLQYAFIEFVNKKDCEQAYLKMENVLIDDRRIHVDFSQSVAKLHKNYVRGTSSAGGAKRSNKNKKRGRRDYADRRNNYERNGPSSSKR